MILKRNHKLSFCHTYLNGKRQRILVGAKFKDYLVIPPSVPLMATSGSILFIIFKAILFLQS